MIFIQITELVDSITTEGLKEILRAFGEPCSYPRSELIDNVKNLSNYLDTKELLGVLTTDDLKRVCYKNDLSVNGTRTELINRIVTHSERIVTLVATIKA